MPFPGNPLDWHWRVPSPWHGKGVLWTRHPPKENPITAPPTQNVTAPNKPAPIAPEGSFLPKSKSYVCYLNSFVIKSLPPTFSHLFYVSIEVPIRNSDKVAAKSPLQMATQNSLVFGSKDPFDQKVMPHQNFVRRFFLIGNELVGLQAKNTGN